MNADASAFDPSQFLDATTTEALVRRPPLPVGDYVGTITDVAIRPWHSNKEDAKLKDGFAADLKITIDLTGYPETQKVVGVNQVILNDGLMLNMKEDNPQAIDWGTGKNAQLRRYREALGMNTAGQPFSIRQMSGRQIRVKIKHRVYQNEAYEEIDSVSKA
jgi:hypothetical protein